MALKVLKTLLVNGTPHQLDGAIVRDKTTGKTFSDIVTEVGGIPAVINQSVNVLKDGTTDGSGGLPADHSTLLKLSTALTGLKSTVNAFLNGEADGGTMDRLVELVTAIGQNKTSIDALTSDKVAKVDIVDALTSEDATKVLSAAQGKALKALIDELTNSVNSQIAALHSHDNKAVIDAISKNAAGDLVFNGKALDGATSVAVLATADATPVYDAKIAFVVEEIETPTA